jgi:hypothetical protein
MIKTINTALGVQLAPRSENDKEALVTTMTSHHTNKAQCGIGQSEQKKITTNTSNIFLPATLFLFLQEPGVSCCE